MIIKLIDKTNKNHKSYCFDLLLPTIRIGKFRDDLDYEPIFEIRAEFDTEFCLVIEKHFWSIRCEIFGLGAVLAYQERY
jgi:hypothetical protein